jgi:hypothetical protein
MADHCKIKGWLGINTAVIFNQCDAKYPQMCHGTLGEGQNVVQVKIEE